MSAQANAQSRGNDQEAMILRSAQQATCLRSKPCSRATGCAEALYPSPSMPVFSLALLVRLVWIKEDTGNCLFRYNLACRLLFSGCTIKPAGATSGQDRFQQFALNCKQHSTVPEMAWMGKCHPFNSDER